MTPTASIAAQRSSRKGWIIGVCLVALTLLIAVIVAKPGADAAAPAGTATSSTSAAKLPAATAARSAGPLTAREANFDFGTISMAAGNVSHRYWFTNDGNAPVLVRRIHTSCMCTTAKLVKSLRVIGTYGMAGHGPQPDVNESFAPGETAYVDVVFDPAAHGPAGLGRTERVVNVETDAGQRLQLAFVVNVRP